MRVWLWYGLLSPLLIVRGRCLWQGKMCDCYPVSESQHKRAVCVECIVVVVRAGTEWTSTGLIAGKSSTRSDTVQQTVLAATRRCERLGGLPTGMTDRRTAESEREASASRALQLPPHSSGAANNTIPPMLLNRSTPHSHTHTHRHTGTQQSNRPLRPKDDSQQLTSERRWAQSINAV